MTDATWTAIGPEDAEWRVCSMEGSIVVQQGLFASREEGLDEVGHGGARIVEIGAQAASVPMAVLPEPGPVPDAMQSQPEDRLPAWARVELAGFLATRVNWDGVVCRATADVTHWIQISANEIVSFQGFVTGRLIKALGGVADVDETVLSDAMSRPEKLAAYLRRADLAEDARAVTSALIGAELSAARAYWLGQAIGIIGGVWPYHTVLSSQAAMVETADRDEMRAEGLAEIARKFGLAVG